MGMTKYQEDGFEISFVFEYDYHNYRIDFSNKDDEFYDNVASVKTAGNIRSIIPYIKNFLNEHNFDRACVINTDMKPGYGESAFIEKI